MRIFLTGANGMVGKNILESGILDLHDVYSPSRQELNLLNFHDVKLTLKKYQPDLVIHCAGVVGGIQANIKEPVRFLFENLEIGKNVVWASHELEIKKLINLSSSCMYPKDKDTALLEDDILTGPLEPTNEGYALAKIATAKLCMFISKQFPEFHYKTLVPCNLYGRWDKFDLSFGHMIPAVIRKIHEAVENKSTTVEIWGDGSARREFMYTADLADFILFSLKNFEALPTTINVGLGQDYSILDYYKHISTVVGFTGEFKFDLSKPVGMKRKLVDVSRARALGWKSKTTLLDGITATYKFYLNQSDDQRN